MAGYFPSVSITNDERSFDQGFSEIESLWETHPANGGINYAGKWKGLDDVQGPRPVILLATYVTRIR